MQIRRILELGGLFLALGCGDAASDEGFTPAGGGSSLGGASSSGGSGGALTTGGSGGAGNFGGGGLQSGGSGGATGGGAGQAGAGGSGGAGAATGCLPMPACNGALPNVGPKRSWKDTIGSTLITATGFDNHRGRDLVLLENEEQWVIGKFAYGVIDKDLKGEEVDIWLNRDCGATWEKLGTAITTPKDGTHPTVYDVTDSGGRVYYKIPAAKKLGLGRHRFRLVVAGDLSGADMYIEVVPPNTHYFVTDVDGTLTTKETEEYSALLTASVSDSNTDAPAALSLLAARGYRPMYLTARPEFLVGRTREFIKKHGYPLGVVRTTTGLGALGSAAVGFKRPEVDGMTGKGLFVDYGFGNTDSDAEAFFLGNIQPASHRIMYRYTDGTHGSRRIEAYTELLSEFAALTNLCP